MDNHIPHDLALVRFCFALDRYSSLYTARQRIGLDGLSDEMEKQLCEVLKAAHKVLASSELHGVTIRREDISD